MKAGSDRNLLVQDFDRLPREIQWTHFGSLVAVTISAVLLITPAAYHRVAEHGEDSEQFHNFASRVMLAAMFFLGLGLAGDFFVVTYKISRSWNAVSNWQLAIGRIGGVKPQPQT
jgi:hypothetical protein